MTNVAADTEEEIEERKDREAEKHALQIAGVVALVVVALWLLTPVVVALLVQKGLAERGQFGDIFGSINALFSGLAFAGVVIAILLQRRELALQRKELKLTRREMKASTAAQDEAQRALNKTIYAQSFRVAQEIMDAPEAIEARRQLYRYRESLLKTSKEWPETAKSSADLTWRRFESVGTMVRKGLLPIEYILDTWSVPIDRAWQYSDNYIRTVRKERNDPFIGKEFEALALEAKKFLEEFRSEQQTPS